MDCFYVGICLKGRGHVFFELFCIHGNYIQFSVVMCVRLTGCLSNCSLTCCSCMVKTVMPYIILKIIWWFLRYLPCLQAPLITAVLCHSSDFDGLGSPARAKPVCLIS